VIGDRITEPGLKQQHEPYRPKGRLPKDRGTGITGKPIIGGAGRKRKLLGKDPI